MSFFGRDYALTCQSLQHIKVGTYSEKEKTYSHSPIPNFVTFSLLRSCSYFFPPIFIYRFIIVSIRISFPSTISMLSHFHCHSSAILCWRQTKRLKANSSQWIEWSEADRNKLYYSLLSVSVVLRPTEAEHSCEKGLLIFVCIHTRDPQYRITKRTRRKSPAQTPTNTADGINQSHIRQNRTEKMLLWGNDD